MSKRKLELNTGMHPSNPYYNNKPDFIALAELYPSLKPFLIFKTEKSCGSVSQATINFQDPVALRELTYCLLKRDFSIQLDIPLDSLCPPLPNRLNYICWIEDLMKNDTKKDIRGIDISIAFANKNISTNRLEQTITVMKITSSKIFQDELFLGENNCMCNPPFYESEQDIQDSFMGKEDRPFGVCQGTSNEMITKGGEVQFVKQMIDESSSRRERIRRAITRQKLATKDSAKDVIGNIERPSEPVILEFDLRVVPILPKHPSASSSGPTESTGIAALGLGIEQIWTSGLDRALFESFFLHLKNEVNKGPLEVAP
ncbi:Methyltransferase-like protein 16 [Haplosporangium sp. Z 767]|nr:Methyltransferase-like protein 16 [Haplosporangium sp. Z 767]